MTKVAYKGKPAEIIMDAPVTDRSGFRVLIEVDMQQFWVRESDLEEIAIIKDKGPGMLEFYGDY